jgi:hypothetical protein
MQFSCTRAVEGNDELASPLRRSTGERDVGGEAEGPGEGDVGGEAEGPGKPLKLK